MRFYLQLFCLTLSLSADAAQRISEIFSLEKTECQSLKDDTQEKLSALLIKNALDPRFAEVQYHWTPGYWSRYGAGSEAMDVGTVSPNDFFNPTPPPNNPPYYVDPVCKIQIGMKAQGVAFQKHESQKSTGKGRHQVCEKQIENLKAQPDTFLIRSVTGGIINRYCQVSYFKLTKN